MCGFAGFVALGSPHDPLTCLTQMRDSLSHRGPDDKANWSDDKAGVYLGFRRLSIVDLSAEGAQPMASPDGRFVITFNGEIYNFLDLRKELLALGHQFRGTSDTEVLLGAVSQWGVQKTLERANGMFSFALWDRQSRKLVLARDRMGEKPLYYGWNGSFFFFASELKALRAHPGFTETLNVEALSLFLQFSYIPAPYSIAQGIFKLEPGKILELPVTGKKEDPKVYPYWSAWETFQTQARHQNARRTSNPIEELRHLLLDSVRLRLQADVPVGAFLSGGIDSSLVVALMQEVNASPVSTFTIGFTENSYNEAPFARAIAEHLQTRHTEFTVTPEETRAVIPLLPTIYDEPFADSSQIPTYLVSKLARKHVTVSLSGDGGDELFGGYHRHAWIQKLKLLRSLPLPVRSMVASSLRLLSPLAWQNISAAAGLPKIGGTPLSGQKISKLAKILVSKSPSEVYEAIASQWNTGEAMSLLRPKGFLEDPGLWPRVSDAEKIMFLDATTYLPDDILAKLDRASMAASLRSRVPLLDPRIVEWAWRLPLTSKIQANQGKWILREVLKQYVPVHLFDRPKSGFSIPLDSWIRGPLKDWAQDLLSEKGLADQGLNVPAIRGYWREHLSEKINHLPKLWNLLIYQSWRQAH